MSAIVFCVAQDCCVIRKKEEERKIYLPRTITVSNKKKHLETILKLARSRLPEKRELCVSRPSLHFVSVSECVEFHSLWKRRLSMLACCCCYWPRMSHTQSLQWPFCLPIQPAPPRLAAVIDEPSGSRPCQMEPVRGQAPGLISPPTLSLSLARSFVFMRRLRSLLQNIDRSASDAARCATSS